MDQDVLNLQAEAAATKATILLRVNDLAGGGQEISFNFGDQERRLPLKALGDLYGPGNDVDTVDPQDDRFMPLFLAIEEAIARYYRYESSSLSDGTAGLVIEQLGMEPDFPTSDELAIRVQVALRLCLSLNNYSRREVKAALKKVGKSIERHRQISGPRGYLEFIASHFAR